MNEPREPAAISPAAVPLLFLGLLVGFFSGYFLLWWGAIAVLAAVVLAAVLLASGRGRDGAATALLLGTLGSYVVVMLLAAFRGVLF